MPIRVQILIDIELKHTAGKFAARHEIVQALVDELNGTDPGEIYGLGTDGETNYEVVSFDANEADD